MSILKSSLVVSGWTAVSRLFGFLRDVVIANKLGASAASDAFFIALIIPNLLRRLFAEGAFNVAFVPILSRISDEEKANYPKDGKCIHRGGDDSVYTDETSHQVENADISTSPDKMYTQQSPAENVSAASTFSSATLTMLMLILIVVTILAEIFMPWVVGTVIAPGIKSDGATFATTVSLCRISFPYLMLITFASLAGSICNVKGKFAPFAFVPVLLNIVFIISLFTLPEFGVEPAFAATIAIPIGGIIQALYMWNALRKLPFKLRFKWQPSHPDLKPLLRRIGPAALGVGVLQISFLIDMHLASYLGDKAISYLSYANRFYQLPMAIIGVALATVLLPHFSRALKNNDTKTANRSYSDALTYGLALGLASAVGLFLLSEELIGTLFGHGEFDAHSVQMSAYAMMAFCVGLPAFVITKVTITAFYANEDTKTPVKISLVSLAINVIANLILMQYYGHVGIAAATAIAGWSNAAMQLWFLRRQGFISLEDTRKFFTSLSKTVVIASCMVGGLLLFKQFVTYGDSFGLQAIWLSGAVLLGLGIFAILAHFSGLICLHKLIRKFIPSLS